MRKYLDIIKLAEGTERTEAPLAETVIEEAVVEDAAAPAHQSLQHYLDEVKTLHESLAASHISDIDVREFIDGYIKCLLWSSTDGDDEPLDKHYTEADLSPEALDQIEADCRSFLHKAGPFITAERYTGAKLGSLEAHAGHDFWLTRVGHGSGFWDGDWEGEDGDGPLTKAAHAFGNVDPYIGDDGKIHLM